MGSSLPPDLNLQTNHVTWPRRLHIALIGPNERGRRAVASALKNSPKANVFEFDSYPPERGYIRSAMESTFDVLILELDSNVEFALDLIREASECPGAAVLAYSTRSDSELTSKALQTGTLAYSIFDDASELQQQIDRIAAAYSVAEEESVTASQSEEHPHQLRSQLPAILPEDFDGWDYTVSDGSRGNEIEAEKIQSSAAIERAGSDNALGPSLDHTTTRDEKELSWMKQGSSKNEPPFVPQTLSNAVETKLHNSFSAAPEKRLNISTSKLWSGMLFSGEKRRTQRFDSAQLRDADQALEHIFRRGEEKTYESNTPRRKVKIVSLMSLATILIVAIALIVWLRPQPSLTRGQKILQAPASKTARTAVSAKAPRPQSPPTAHMPLRDTSEQ